MLRFCSIMCLFVTLLAIVAEDASAQIFRRRGNCGGGGCGVSSGCNVGSGSSQGCNISSAPQPTRASADDLLQARTAAPKVSAPVLPARPEPLAVDPAAALAFCAPVESVKHRLDLENVVYRQRAPLGAVASR